MYRHLAFMKEKHGERHFRFLPNTYILPAEMNQLQEDMIKNP